MNRKNLFSDLLSSVVVFLVALPLCMGIAIASGAPPAAGLITGIVGGLLVGALQGSPLQVSGPAAGLSVIVCELVQKHGLAALGVVVLAAGAVQLVAGLLRGARWFRMAPPSVIHGMLAGIGVLIFASQFHVMVDDNPKGSGLQNLITIPQAVWKGVASSDDMPHQEAAIIGLLTIAVLIAWNKLAKGRLRLLPGALVAVVVATAASNLLRLPIAHVAVPEQLWSAVEWPTAATLGKLADPSLIGAALVLAVVASAETLLSAVAVDRLHQGPRTMFDKELIAQGVGNMVCGALGALPMTGVIVRSSANVQAGARTRASAIFHGAWLLVAVMALPWVLRLVPVASLGAVLVFTGYKLVNPAIVAQLRRFGRTEVAVYFATIAAIVSTDLLKGVAVGVAISIVKLLYTFSHIDIEIEDHPDEKRAVLHLRGAAMFLRLADIAEALESLPHDRELHVKFEQLEFLDHATLELLESWEKQHVARGGDVIVDWDDLNRRYHLGRQPAGAGAGCSTCCATSRPG